jgi:hypothetical protein
MLACGLGFLATGDSARADNLSSGSCTGNWGTSGTNGIVCSVEDFGGIGHKQVFGNTFRGNGTQHLRYNVATSWLNGIQQNPATGQVLAQVKCCPTGSDCGASWTTSPAQWTSVGGAKEVPFAQLCAPNQVMARTRCKAATWCD